jgi:hypothetical protein
MMYVPGKVVAEFGYGNRPILLRGKVEKLDIGEYIGIDPNRDVLRDEHRVEEDKPAYKPAF